MFEGCDVVCIANSWIYNVNNILYNNVWIAQIFQTKYPLQVWEILHQSSKSLQQRSSKPPLSSKWDARFATGNILPPNWFMVLMLVLICVSYWPHPWHPLHSCCSITNWRTSTSNPFTHTLMIFRASSTRSRLLKLLIFCTISILRRCGQNSLGTEHQQRAIVCKNPCAYIDLFFSHLHRSVFLLKHRTGLFLTTSSNRQASSSSLSMCMWVFTSFSPVMVTDWLKLMLVSVPRNLLGVIKQGCLVLTGYLRASPLHNP